MKHGLLPRVSWVLLLLLANLSCSKPHPGHAPPAPPSDSGAPVFRLQTVNLPDPPEHFKSLQPGELRRRFVRFDFERFRTLIEEPARRGAEPVVKLELFDGLGVTIKTSEVTVDRDTRIWEGVPRANVFGRMSVALTDRAVFGVIQVDQKVFELFPVADGVVAITEIDQGKLPPEGPPLVAQRAPRTGQVPPPPKPGAATGPTFLQVLILLPRPFVLCRIPIFDFRKAIERAAENSLKKVFNAVMPTDIFANVIVECTDQIPQGGDLIADLQQLRGDPAVAALRNKHFADVVSLFVPSGTVCGRGIVNTPLPIEPADEANAFNVVVRSCAFGNFSLAHEIGHNLGMRHDRTPEEGGGASPDCNFGHVFDVETSLFFKTKARTVMAVPNSCGDCMRLGVFSNPATIDLGPIELGPMGVDCSAPANNGVFTRANNRQVLIDSAPIAAAFRQEPVIGP